MKIFILLSVVAAALATRQCGKNSQYQSCGTACPLTCDNYDNPPKACILMCNPGCHCDAGYVKNAEGECVKPEECSAMKSVFLDLCKENEHFDTCGTACPMTCDNYDNPPKFCVLRCDIGCQCDEGYVRNSENRCVKPEECPARAQQVCGENERYTSCGSACPLTCDNYNNPPKICPLMCVMGCACEKGFVKTNDGRCVRPENCPSSARPTEKTCLDKPDGGLCLAYFPSWYYDVKTGKCHKFIYGGCEGNGNNYETEEECLQNCENVRPNQSSSSEACDLPSETGVCRGLFPRFFFDRTTGQCKRFIYGGCGGNENNFETVEECEQTCAPAAPSACQEEKEVGPCRGGFIRFFFNQKTGQCEEFTYGGCLGNSNNFHSKDECENVCIA